MPKPLPEVRRVSYAEHAQKVAATLAPPDDAGRLAAEACRLEPLQRIQVTFDQLAGRAEARRRGEPWPYDHAYAGHVKAEMQGVQRHREVLQCAAAAADAMIDQMERQILDLETAMAKQKDDETPPPQLTPSGEPHPLQKGGYDPNADPQLPGNISDVEALKEGKTTRAQGEAIAASDAEEEKPPLDPPTEAPPPDDDDEPKRRSSKKGHK